jgi:hypothetical protein
LDVGAMSGASRAPKTIPMIPRKTAVQPGRLSRKPGQKVLARKGICGTARNMSPTTPTTAKTAKFSVQRTRRKRAERTKTLLKTNEWAASPSALNSRRHLSGRRLSILSTDRTKNATNDRNSRCKMHESQSGTDGKKLNHSWHFQRNGTNVSTAHSALSLACRAT